jgi:hypothetical protein
MATKKKPAEGLARIQFNGRPKDMLVIDENTSVQGGEQIDIDANMAQELAAAPWANVSLVDGNGKPVPKWPNTHPELDAVAEKLGYAFPSGGGQSVAEKQTALDDAGFTPVSAPASAA